MIILNHPLIPAVKLTKVANREDIATTPANKTVWIEFDLELMRYCYDNGVHYAVSIENEVEAAYANALGAGFVMCNLDIAQKIQKLAEHYLFDAKVIALVDERLLDKAIEAGIDGAYLTNYTKTLSK